MERRKRWNDEERQTNVNVQFQNRHAMANKMIIYIISHTHIHIIIQKLFLLLHILVETDKLPFKGGGKEGWRVRRKKERKIKKERKAFI